MFCRFVLLLDRSSKRKDVNLAQTIRHGLNQWIDQLPAEESEVAIISFTSKDARINLRPTIVYERSREGIQGRIPRRLSRDNKDGCLQCALQKLESLKKSSDSKTKVIVFSKSKILSKELSTETYILYFGNVTATSNVQHLFKIENTVNSRDIFQILSDISESKYQTFHKENIIFSK